MPKITIIDNWEDELYYAISKKMITYTRVQDRVREAAFQAVNRVKREMPVDTGAAKSSWGSQPSSPPAEPTDGIFYFVDDGFVNVQGSNRGYIEDLNNGSSRQAPAGFLDRIEQELGDILGNNIAEDLARG